MGYEITIGEYKEYEFEDGTKADSAVIISELSDAPDNGRGGQSNDRWPSYSAWGDFLRSYSLKDYELFIWSSDSGAIDITANHVAYLKGLKKPDTYEYNHERFAWLIFWCEWAIKNCKRPVIAWF